MKKIANSFSFFIFFAVFVMNCPLASASGVNYLEQAVEDILYEVQVTGEKAVPSSTEPDMEGTEQGRDAEHVAPPPGASHYRPPQEAGTVSVEPTRINRSRQKQSPESGVDFISSATSDSKPGPWREVSFSSGSFTPPSGLDPDMASELPALRTNGRKFVYGFILMDEYLSRETRGEMEALGVTILGPHSSLFKAKFPLDIDVLESLLDLPYVEWIGYSMQGQKLSLQLNQMMSTEAGSSIPQELPITINLFEHDADNAFKQVLEETGATIGAYDPELCAYRAVATQSQIDQIILLDFVLFVEPVLETTGGTDQSMPTIGADYIRALGTSFDGSSTALGIMDSGFDMGGGGHMDLNKYGCGYSEVPTEPNVWNDQHGHGTHVLATLCGTGSGDARYRGVAMGVGSSSSNYIRAVKIFDSLKNGNTLWTENAMDFMDDSCACGGCVSPRPKVINYSGGAFGPNRGTDSTSRKLDEKVWTYDQVYVVAVGNRGPELWTVETPGVAKNALTVGNVMADGYETVGDIATNSSRGPTGDGRMKPNLVAPGTWITSADAGTTNQYFERSGSSMATPHVSGLVATFMEHNPWFEWKPAILRAHLMATSILHDDNTTPDSNDSGGRHHYGMGRISSYIAHGALGGSEGWYTHWFYGNVTDTTYMQNDINVPTGTDRLVVVMTWDEPPASAGASAAVIYDLDLWADYNCDHPSEPNDKGQGGEYASRSWVDNVEYLIINNPPAGCYRLKAANYDAPASGLPVGMAALVIQGDPTPAMSMTATPSTSTPVVGSTFTVTTTVSNPSYVASGVHISLNYILGGLTQLGIETTREDGVVMDFGTQSDFTLGNIRASDSRSAVWRFRADSPGEETLLFRIWSENGGTVTKTVSVIPGSPPPTPASISYPSSDNDGNFTVSWSSSSGATGYTLQRATNASFSGAVTVYTGPSTSYNQTGLGNGTYYYRVSASNVYGSSGWRNGGSIVVSSGSAPPIPASISYPSSDNDGNFTVSWSSSSGATGYTLQRATNASFSGAVTVYTGSSTSYNQTGLGNGTYYYRVSASNVYGSSGWRNGGSIVVSSGSAPPIPASISYPSSDNDGNFTVSWSSSSGATSYTLQRATNASFTGAVTVYTGSSTSYNQTGLGNNTYYYRVSASNVYGSSGWRNGGPIVVSSGSAPPIPASISYPSSDNDGNFTVSWSSSSGATSYTLQRATNASFTGAVTVYTGSSTSYNQTGLGNNTYYYRVSASNVYGSSGWRNGGPIVVSSSSSLFIDVPPDHWAYDAIYKIYNAGITKGCSVNPLMYCPDKTVSKAAMAVFLLRSLHGGNYTPPPATGIFTDVNVNEWYAPWVEQLYKEGITKGCSASPLMYCPDRDVSKASMALFLLRAKYGSNYIPPVASGIFTDVPLSHWGADWIEKLYNDGITQGCSADPLMYCPDRAVSRAAMALFLVRTFGL